MSPSSLSKFVTTLTSRLRWCHVVSKTRSEKVMQFLSWLSWNIQDLCELIPCCEELELPREATCQRSAQPDNPSWAQPGRDPSPGARLVSAGPPDDNSPQLLEFPLASHAFPAAALDITEQRQATLLCPVPIPDPSPIEPKWNGCCFRSGHL